MATLAEIREKLKQKEERTPSVGDGLVFPFWDMEPGESCTIRFLPDGNPDIDFFWVERLTINLPFVGVKGQPGSKMMTVGVPCMEMYNKQCPVLTEVRNWFKDPQMETQGRKYWKKYSYVFQHLVVDSPLKDDPGVDRVIRRSILRPQLFKIIKHGLLDPEIEDMPTDYVNGLDFRINKMQDGQFPDYGTSDYSRRTRPLTEEELAAIKEHGLSDLSDAIPPEPDEEGVKLIAEMFEASVDGEAYDKERFGRLFGAKTRTTDTPVPSSNTSNNNDNTVRPTVETQRSSAPEPKPEPELVKETVSASNSGEDILAMIRSRK